MAEMKATLERQEAELARRLRQESATAAEQSFEVVAGEVPDAGDASVADLAVDDFEHPQRLERGTEPLPSL